MTHPLVSPDGEWRRDVLSDGEVVTRVLAGETELFELLLRRHNQRLFRAVRPIVRDDDEAQEVVQVSHVKAWKALSSFEGRSQYGTWITRIALRTAHALRRQRRRRREVEELAAESDGHANRHADSADGPLEEGELRRMMEHLIQRLPFSSRVAFMLHVVQGESIDAVAASLEISAVAVRVRVHRAREELKVRLLDRAEAMNLTGQVWAFAGARCDKIVVSVFATILTD